MKRINFILIGLLLTACTTTSNVSPPPTFVPDGMTKQEVEYVLISCLGSPADQEKTSSGMYMANEILNYHFGREFIRKKHWHYEGRGEDTVYAGFENRAYYMRIEIAYSTKEVILSIVDSRNLRQNETQIHKSALKWLGGLERGIRSCFGEYDRLRYQKSLNK